MEASAKKLLPLVLVLTLPSLVHAQFNYTVNNGTISITGYTGSDSAVTIPPTINGLPVTSIGHSAFLKYYPLASVAIPNTVIGIGHSAFSECTNLLTVTIGTSVTSIGDSVFSGCISLTNVLIPNSVTSIGSCAFSNCTSLPDLTIPDSVVSIGDSVFSGCTSLTNVSIPNSVVSIGDGVFSGCIRLPNITIPNRVTTIGTHAFTSCTSLTDVTIPDSVVSIGDDAFFYCTALTNMSIGTNVTSIGAYAFFYCINLTSITIPATVTNIGSYAFSDCTSLNAVYFQGSPPIADSTVFNNDNAATVYFLPGTAGWGTNFAGRPTMLFCPPESQTALYAFTPTTGSGAGTGGTNMDGTDPVGGLILSGETLYGAANSGGTGGSGTLFKINTDGSGFTNLHSFPATPGMPNSLINNGGAFPNAGLSLSGETLYGTTAGGGSSGNGIVFKVSTDGSGFMTVHTFAAGIGHYPYLTNSDGAHPAAQLFVSGTTLFGTTWYGGSWGNGTIFRVNTNGSGFTNLHSFTATISYTNSDGSRPDELVVSGNTLYGSTRFGGTWGNGTVFKVTEDGTGFKTLHSFTPVILETNSDGAYPNALILSGNTLYGTAGSGGSWGKGTVFRINTDGSGFKNLHSLAETSDGAGPKAVILSGNTLYGTAGGGGRGNSGTIFKVNTDGTGFTTVYSFSPTIYSGQPYYSLANCDGAYPNALILSGNTLYGTASGGGRWGNGTVFKLFIPPQLTIIPSGPSVVLTWQTNIAGFTLHSTTNLGSVSAWIPVSQAPVIVNGQNTVTNPILSAQQFYRLIQ